MLLFALLVLILGIIARVAIDHYEDSPAQVLFDLRWRGYVDDAVGIAAGLLVYGFRADGLLDVELIKDLVLGYLIATKSFQYVLSHVYQRMYYWRKRKAKAQKAKAQKA